MSLLLTTPPVHWKVLGSGPSDSPMLGILLFVITCTYMHVMNNKILSLKPDTCLLESHPQRVVNYVFHCKNHYSTYLCVQWHRSGQLAEWLTTVRLAGHSETVHTNTGAVY